MAAFGELIFLVAGSVLAGFAMVVPSYLLALRLGRNPMLFAIMALIPGINLIFFFVLAVMVLLHILDRLNAIADRDAA